MRMLLDKAGVQYEDVRLTQEQFAEMKSSGTLESGQVPMLELDDGSKLFQTDAVLFYLARLHGFMPEDPLQNHNGHAMMSSYNEDFVQKKMYPVMFMPEGPEKEEAVKKVFAEDAPKYLATLDKRLQNSKFLCGDKLSCYDFVVGGMWTNFVENPNNPGSAMMT